MTLPSVHGEAHHRYCQSASISQHQSALTIQHIMYCQSALILAVPWVSLSVVPVALTGTLVFTLNETAGQLLLQLAGVLLDVIWLLLEWLSSLDYVLWQQHEPVVWTLLPAIFSLAVLFMPRGLPGRWAGLLLLLPLFLVKPAGPARGAAREHRQ